MEAPYFNHIASLCWVVFFIAWLIFALKQKKLKSKEAQAERFKYMLPTVVGYFLLFSPNAEYGWLGTRFVPRSAAVSAAGLALTVAGIAFAIWARWHLGTNWSAAVTIRENHELIGTGPYRSIRHPIYTGMFLATIGTALALGQVRGLISLLIIVAAFYTKARKEETWLAREFGPAFEEHARHRGMFLPRFS